MLQSIIHSFSRMKKRSKLAQRQGIRKTKNRTGTSKYPEEEMRSVNSGILLKTYEG